MSHHFVTVCVVCVLCATHNPCSAHTELSTAGQKTHNSVNSENLPGPNEQLQPSWLLMKFKESKEKDNKKTNINNLGTYKNGAVKFSNSVLNNSNVNKIPNLLVPSTDEVHTKRKTLQNMKVDKNVQAVHVPAIEESFTTLKDLEIMERLGQTEINYNKELKSIRSTKNPSPITVIRRKRNVDVIDEKYFMKKIFETYGDGTSVTMDGFEKLLRKLGLLRLLTDISKLEDLNTITSHENPLEKSKNMQNNGLSDYENGVRKERCLNSKELLSSVARDMPYNSITNNNTTLPSWLFERVCPALVYQLAGESSSERNGCILVPENYKPVIVSKYLGEDVSRNMVQVWAYSIISILIISLCGLFGVAVIPFMGKIYYHQLLQFLVALAVGTLCGDALIHLLPHAMMSHDHSHDHHSHDDNDHADMDHKEQHNINMWKGVVAMMGLVLFFFTEKALTLVAEWRKLRQRRNKLPSRVRVMRETDGPNSNVVGEKLCKHKYSSYPYCYGEINTDTQDNHHNRQHNNHERPPVIEEEKPLTSNCNSVSKIMTNDVEKKPNEDWRLDDSIVNTKKNTDGADIPLNKSESYTVIIREHETKHHGHTHSHGHVHSAPESMSSVAWMVVMGDGLHNFTDGMAIGAAFSANIAGGFSTAIAVFCHELPHEIGDFAVLLKAGMSAKQAVFYNLLSSVLCLFGMIFGVLLGSTPAVSSWMFAAAAGMFIYIALVDMIPELSSSHSAERSSQWQCILQGLGLSCGLGIMLIIALYEHDLKTMFSD
ncbi:zinc transporter foi [Nomia melanderi]|uniref:zinc transporter foi n=1 Tax=Nomia melanderi TaxID=2448451 RepID=UPI0013045F2C|nr:zinc transporter foi-like [Nomia melanderi]XP_031837284.1 zinc transporter foi-like [Nomia melanderi]XP_031837294.1 zinc transporter foi-like [Nomia melanderi]XP_031837302.1 zinc transporter foi-like [Nomia melanderi]XP_031837312.1 zinc transporter foi-like [Nomia melanderi]XP_031837319.1 zinc transporter foi-like [Nomia melanderi]XP_031837329.1 zinc transporter foi-like [Nomia melanderi]XP_031837338.1 zinc transporter foi-like [Nomia melanderi]XP_031837349.1 zinc transporter foi-like [N